jgi:uncharacterized protein YjbJ (UPF0337 family)
VSQHLLKQGNACAFPAGSPWGAAQNPAKGAIVMKPSTKDEAEGKFHEVKGKVKEKAGQLTNNPRLEADGTVEKVGGKVQGIVSQVEKALEK